MKKRNHLIKDKGFGLIKIKGSYVILFNTSLNSKISGLGGDPAKTSAGLSTLEQERLIAEAIRQAWDKRSPGSNIPNPFLILTPLMGVNHYAKERNLLERISTMAQNAKIRLTIRAAWDRIVPGSENTVRRIAFKEVEKSQPKPYILVDGPTVAEMWRNLQDLPYDTPRRFVRFSKEFIKACTNINPSKTTLVSMTGSFAYWLVEGGKLAVTLGENLPTYLISLSRVPIVKFQVGTGVLGTTATSTTVNPLIGAITIGTVINGVLLLLITDASLEAWEAMSKTPTEGILPKLGFKAGVVSLESQKETMIAFTRSSMEYLEANANGTNLPSACSCQIGEYQVSITRETLKLPITELTVSDTTPSPSDGATSTVTKVTTTSITTITTTSTSTSTSSNSPTTLSTTTSTTTNASTSTSANASTDSSSTPSAVNPPQDQLTATFSELSSSESGEPYNNNNNYKGLHDFPKSHPLTNISETEDEAFTAKKEMEKFTGQPTNGNGGLDKEIEQGVKRVSEDAFFDKNGPHLIKADEREVF